MTTLTDFFLQPLSYDFMQRAILAAILVGIVCAVVGTYVVLRGMAFFGDALAHTILPGIAVGYLFSGGARDVLFWWALGTAVLAALGIGTDARAPGLVLPDRVVFLHERNARSAGVPRHRCTSSIIMRS